MSATSEVDRHLCFALSASNRSSEEFVDRVFHYLAKNTEFYKGFPTKSAKACVEEKFAKYELLASEPPEKKIKSNADDVDPNNTDQSTGEVVASDSGSDLIPILEMRRKNMRRSKQFFSSNLSFLLDKKYPAVLVIEKPRIDFPIDNNPWNINRSPSLDYQLEVENGLVRIYESKECKENKQWKKYEYLDRSQFVLDMQLLCTLNENQSLITYCKQRLENLKASYEVYRKGNAESELCEQRKVLKDFYSVYKVDTHIHGAGCMTAIRLLNFIRKKYHFHGTDEVYRNSDGKVFTLKEVFQLENIQDNDLNLERLNMGADEGIFNNFAEFNNKFKPFGSDILREIFLKTNNHINGRYFGELIKEIISEYTDESYQAAEIRLTVYGKDLNELTKLAHWAKENGLYSKYIRWIIQIPRIFNKIKILKPNHCFGDIIKNIFLPLFHITINPDKDIVLHSFLKYVVGIDCVDDESDITDHLFQNDTVTPENWVESKNPPYSYYLFYLYSNISVLNQFRSEQGLSLFSLRPHCGESGPPHHLATAFLLAESISHGIVLEKENPFLKFFYQGLRVSLSTDDPLVFHFTDNPLLEEYAVAVPRFNLNSAEICELARNSVLMSGFDKQTKVDWAGHSFKKKVNEDNIKKSNVPVLRDAYRHKKMEQELAVIFK